LPFSLIFSASRSAEDQKESKGWIPAYAGMTRKKQTEPTPSPPNPPLEGEG
jgi:hypothetical protein